MLLRIFFRYWKTHPYRTLEKNPRFRVSHGISHISIWDCKNGIPRNNEGILFPVILENWKAQKLTNFLMNASYVCRLSTFVRSQKVISFPFNLCSTGAYCQVPTHIVPKKFSFLVRMMHLVMFLVICCLSGFHHYLMIPFF